MKTYMKNIKDMKVLKKVVITCIFTLVFITSLMYSYAKVDSSYSTPTNMFYINDFANILSSETKNYVLSKGKEIEDKTTAQLVVTTIDKLNGQDIETFSNELYNKWRIGSKGKNNGILLLISKEDRKIKIEVGYGLEGAINDAKAGRILDDTAIPYLKNNDYDSAVKNTVEVIQQIIYKEYGVEGAVDNYEKSEKIPLIPLIFSIIIFIIIITRYIIIFKRGGFRVRI